MMWFRKIGVLVVLATCLLTSWPALATASSLSISVLLVGQPLAFDVPPQVIQDRTFVPFRKLLESLGARVWWDQSTQTAFAQQDNVIIKMPLGSYNIYKNNQVIHMDVPVQIVQDRTMIPVRFISQALGAKVGWSQTDDHLTVTIDSSSKANVAVPNIQVLSGDGQEDSQTIKHIQDLMESKQIDQNLTQRLGITFTDPITIYLAKDREGYVKVLTTHRVPNADKIASKSEGLALGNTIFLPIFQGNTDGELTNVLAHELTHVLLNQYGLGAKIPSWINEGIAWQEGLDAEYKGQSDLLLAGQKLDIRDEILTARKNGALIKLVSDSNETIMSTAPYNLELQDYMAVDKLTDQFGREKLLNYLNLLNNGDSEAFVNAFGISAKDWEKTFNSDLDQEIAKNDNGVVLTFRVSSGYKGAVGILSKGTNRWGVAHLTPGDYTVEIAADGSITGLTGIQWPGTSEKADPDYLYLGIDPDAVIQEGNQTFTFGGFAIRYSYGSYALGNAWKSSNTATDSVEYLGTSVLGVEILSVQSK